jgi:MFS family permease
VEPAVHDIGDLLHIGLQPSRQLPDFGVHPAHAASLPSITLAQRGRAAPGPNGCAAVFTAGSLLCGIAQSPVFLSLARAGQGVGGAIMFATSLALLADPFRGDDRGVAFGVFGAITGIAVAVGPVLGGAITSALSWRWIFFVNVPIGVIAIALTLLRVEESRDPDAGRPDWLGALSFSGALVALVYGLIESTRIRGARVVCPARLSRP